MNTTIHLQIEDDWTLWSITIRCFPYSKAETLQPKLELISLAHLWCVHNLSATHMCVTANLCWICGRNVWPQKLCDAWKYQRHLWCAPCMVISGVQTVFLFLFLGSEGPCTNLYIRGKSLNPKVLNKWTQYWTIGPHTRMASLQFEIDSSSQRSEGHISE